MTATAKLGRRDNLTTDAKVGFLMDLSTLNNTYYANRMVDLGLIEKENVHTGKRGRPQVRYIVTGKGRGFIALAKNRYQKQETPVATIDPFNLLIKE